MIPITRRLANFIEQTHAQHGQIKEIRITTAQFKELCAETGQRPYKGADLRFWDIPLIVDDAGHASLSNTQAENLH